MGEASSALTVQIPAPGERPRRRGGRHLKAVTTPRRRRSTAVPVLLGAAIVFVGMFLVAGMHALLIDGQIELDALQREVASEAEAVERLRLEVAELEAPDRILSVAQDRLGMQEPAEIGYVLPEGAADADSAELLRVSPATVPPPPTTAPPVVVDTEPAPDASTTIDDAVTAALASAGITPDQTTPAADETTDAEDASPTSATEDGATEAESPTTTGATE